MSDIALKWGTTSADLSVGLTVVDGTLFEADTSEAGDAVGVGDTTVLDDIGTDDGLQTAVFISLFSDRLAEPGDDIPDGQLDRRGWWGDAFPVVAGHLTGSRLWLLDRSKKLPTIPDQAVVFCKEALQWLLDDGVSDRIDVSAEYVGDLLAIYVSIYRPQQRPVTWRYNLVWTGQANAI